MNHSRIRKIDPQFGQQSANIFESELDPEPLKTIKPGERLRVFALRVWRFTDRGGLARPSHSALEG